MTEKAGLFGRLRERLGKTRHQIVDNVRRALRSGRLDEDVIEELESILIQADLGVATTMELIAYLREIAKTERLDSDAALAALKGKLLEMLAPGDHAIHWDSGVKPHVTLIAGVNGSGKTTTIGKLAAKLKASGKSVLLGAGDTFRAAASEQLTIWSERVGVPIVKHQEGADPAAVAYDTTEAAIARGIDCVIIDTAGRLHTKVNLMEEIKKIRRVVNKRLPGAPHQVLLVLDATTGQNALQQARQFTTALEVTGIVLTKLDGTAKGGIVVAIQRELGIPIKFIGVGEGVDDLQAFNPSEFVAALFSE